MHWRFAVVDSLEIPAVFGRSTPPAKSATSASLILFFPVGSHPASPFFLDLLVIDLAGPLGNDLAAWVNKKCGWQYLDVEHMPCGLLFRVGENRIGNIDLFDKALDLLDPGLVIVDGNTQYY